MGCFLEFLSLGLVSMCLWMGIQCDVNNYKIHAPDMVSVQEGLCVIIPCNFMYDTNDASPDSPLYGYWYKTEKLKYDPAVATNDEEKTIEDYARGRFKLSEEVGNGNCSLIISDAKETDENKYYFRMEKEPRAKYSYTKSHHGQPFVNVTKLENPKIQMSGKLQAGHQVNITCIAPESCSLKRPHVSWKGFLDQVKSGTRVTQPNNFKDHISVFSFIPSAADDGQELTCQVTYGEGPDPLYRNKTVYLNVSYPPQKLRISAEVIRSNKSLQIYTAGFQITVEECDTVVLRCKMEGNPLPSVTWQKIPQSSRFIQGPLDNELKLLNVTMQDVGEYKCRAQNTEGFASVSFHLSMASSDAWPQKVINGVISGLIVVGVIMLITAAILIYKKYQRERKAVIDMESHTEQKRIRSTNSPAVKESNNIGHNQGEGKNVSQAQEKMEKGTDEIYSEPEMVHYASVTFIPREPLPKVTSENPPTEYAEIKKSESSDFAGSQADVKQFTII